MSYLLVSTDGFSISHKSFSAYEEAYKEMEKRYKDFDQSEFDDFYKDQSMIGANSAAVYNNGDGVYLWEIIETTPTVEDVLNHDAKFKDDIYRQLWADAVEEDIKSYSKEIDINLTAEQIVAAAKRYVNGDYDCNLDYWSNIESVIRRTKN